MWFWSFYSFFFIYLLLFFFFFSVSDALSNSLASFSVCTLYKSLSGDFASLAYFFDRFLSANTHWYCTVLIVTRVPLVVLTRVCVCVRIHELCQDNLPISYFGFPFISVATNGPDHCCLNCWTDYFPCSRFHMLCLCLWTLAREASGVDSLSSSTRIQAQQQEQPRVSSLFLPSSL